MTRLRLSHGRGPLQTTVRFSSPSQDSSSSLYCGLERTSAAGRGMSFPSILPQCWLVSMKLSLYPGA